MSESPSPYVGPRPFHLGETLYGRQWELRELRDLLIARRIVLLHSPSGAGKTSLIQAGLVPVLMADGFKVLPSPAAVPGLRPWSAIRVGLELPPVMQGGTPTANRYVRSTLASLDEQVRDTSRLSPDQLAELQLPEYLDLRAPVKSADESHREVLIFDQFEEVLTIDPTDLEAKEAFFKQVGKALSDSRRWALFAMREDHVASLEPYLQWIPRRLSSRLRIDLLGTSAARSAIQEPVRHAPVHFTEAAVDKLVADLSRVRIQQPNGMLLEKLGPHIEPVQLQVVCQRLWEGHGSDPGDITEDEVTSFGSVDDALAAYYEERVALVARETGVQEQLLRFWFDEHLITDQGLRSQVQQEAGQTRDLPNTAIRRFVDAHLVREEKRLGSTWFELTHDRLIPPVRKSNAEWREKNMEPWQREAAAWSRAPTPALLLTDPALEDAERTLAREHRQLRRFERDFLDASREARRVRQNDEARQAERRTNLADLGWGVIFAADGDPAIREALAELLDHRRTQAAVKNPEYYKEFSGATGYQKDDTANRFLARHGGGFGFGRPDKVPYYLLIVGDPQAIPYEFQYALDVQFAVGRIDFETWEEYASYARSVVLAEAGGFSLRREIALFAPAHTSDTPTQMATKMFVDPLEATLKRLPDWTVIGALRQDATKARLGEMLGGPDTPAVLVTVSHALGFSIENPDDEAHQGALLCQDWPTFQKLEPHFYFAAVDVSDDARLLGLIGFLVGAFTAGTPRFDEFSEPDSDPRVLSARARTSRLPQRLLGHPNGGALAMIGHVDRSWSYSLWGRDAVVGNVSGVFERALSRLLDGHTVGSAFEPFNQQYAVRSLLFSEKLHALFQANIPREKWNDRELNALKTAMIDARNYVVMGDPAVRLPIDAGAEVQTRPTIERVARRRLKRKHVAATEAAASGPSFVANGVDGATGGYLLPPLTVEQIAALAGGARHDSERMQLLRSGLGQWHNERREPHF